MLNSALLLFLSHQSGKNIGITAMESNMKTKGRMLQSGNESAAASLVIGVKSSHKLETRHAHQNLKSEIGQVLHFKIRNPKFQIRRVRRSGLVQFWNLGFRILKCKTCPISDLKFSYA